MSTTTASTPAFSWSAYSASLFYPPLRVAACTAVDPLTVHPPHAQPPPFAHWPLCLWLPALLFHACSSEAEYFSFYFDL